MAGDQYPDNREQTAQRIFLSSGLVWQLCWSSYWTLFFIRVVVDLELAPLQLVLLGTAKEVTILLVEIPTGLVADLRSRRLSVVLGFAICGTAIIGAGLAQTFTLLLATQALWAFGTTFRSGAETAWFTDELDSVAKVDTVLPRRAQFEAVGSIVGVVGAALVASVAGLSAALVGIGTVLAAWALVLVTKMPETGFRRHNGSTRTQLALLLRQGLIASRRPGLRVLLIVTVLAGFASEAVDRLDIARLDDVGLPDTIDVPILIGAAVILQSLAAIVVLFIFGGRLAGPRLVSAMVALNVITAVGVLALARTDLIVIALAGVIAQGTVRNVARTVTVAWTNHFTERSNRATVHSFVGQAMSLGEISGGITLGLVAQQAGIQPALTASAAIYLVASALAARGSARWRERKVR